MKAEVLLGLAKLLEKEAKGIRDKVAVGTHVIDTDVHLHVSGEINIADDSSYTPTSAIPWKATMAFFLHHSGFTRDRTMELLTLAMQHALKTEGNAEELLQTIADMEEAEALVQAGLDQLPKQNRRGAVSVKELEYTEVNTKRDGKAA